VGRFRDIYPRRIHGPAEDVVDGMRRRWSDQAADKQMPEGTRSL
jgi:hypothetical protein